MKRFSPSSRRLTAVLLAGVASLGCLRVASAQAVRTDAVGLVPWTVPAGQVQALSLPLSEASLYTGAITAVNGLTIQTAGAAWAADAFGPFASNPCVVRMLTGAAQGRSFPIISQVGDVLTLSAQSNSAAVLTAGDRYDIVRLPTLESLFGATATALLTGTDAGKVDNLVIREGSNWVTFYNDGTQWLSIGGTGASQNNTAILPDAGVIVVRRGTTALNLSLTGFVPGARVVTSLPGRETSCVANPFPVDTTLNDLGLHLDTSWLAGPSASTADCVQFYLGNGWSTYFYDGAQWIDATTGAGGQNPALAKGAAFIVIRRGATDILHSQSAPYTSR